MARGYVMLPVQESGDGPGHADVDANPIEGIRGVRPAMQRLRLVTVAVGAVAVACVVLMAYSKREGSRNPNLVAGSSLLLDIVTGVEERKSAAKSNIGGSVGASTRGSMLVQEMLQESGNEDECDEACRMIKDRVKRAWMIGMELFEACGDRKEEGCGDVSKGMCDCEKKAGNVMCSELNYAWEELCPTTQSQEMHKGFCSGKTITETRTMCDNLEYLPGVLINHFPGGQGGLAVIDDNFVHHEESEGCGNCEKAPPAEAAPPAEEEPAAEEPADEGGAEGGEVASGMDASARRRA